MSDMTDNHECDAYDDFFNTIKEKDDTIRKCRKTPKKCLPWLSGYTDSDLYTEVKEVLKLEKERRRK